MTYWKKSPSFDAVATLPPDSAIRSASSAANCLFLPVATLSTPCCRANSLREYCRSFCGSTVES